MNVIKAYDWWLNDMYMDNPIPLPVNSNPGMVFPPRQIPKNDPEAFLTDIADLVNNILDQKDIIEMEAIPQDRAASREKGQPLCMAQYGRLFTSYRSPGLERDSQNSHRPLSVDADQHIIVAHRGQFWRVEVRRKGQRLSRQQMIVNLRSIVQSEQKTNGGDDASVGPGILTTTQRRLWGQWRHQLLQDLTNARSMQLIETSCMIVCIDEPLPAERFNRRENAPGQSVATPVGHRDYTNRAVQMINGGGTKFNSANRWYDKSVQLIFSPDDVSGTCYEHSTAEGIALVTVIEKALEAMKKAPRADGETLECATESAVSEAVEWSQPEKLTWKIDATICNAIETATASMNKLVDDMDFYVYRFNDFGKNRIKSFNVSPDAFLQLMLQLTYFKLHGRLVATYESASTRRFRHGRVDCIRAASLDALHFVRTFNDPKSTDSERVEVFYKAAETQTDIMVKNILGQGIDIHLLGLRELARENKCPQALQLFDDPSYMRIQHFALSTSQIPTNSDSYMGYGAVVPDGYGCSYNPHGDSVVFCVSSFRSCGFSSTSHFVDKLAESLQQVSQLLTNKKLASKTQ